MGYPSWHKLAESTYDKLKELDLVSDSKSYENYLNGKKYPEFFRHAERDFGEDRIAFVNFMKSLFIPTTRKRGVIYELLSKWPFAGYLTTNYDDEIRISLSDSNEHFKIIRNRLEDFYSWRDGASHLIQKLHSDLDHPDEVILTSADYGRIATEYSGQYFRDRLCTVLTMFDILIIGHSLSDPDIDLVLKLAKKVSDPRHPIYLVAADFTKADEQEFLEQYNIVLVRYSNSDGTHSRLLQMLGTVDRFIVPRFRRSDSRTIEPRPDEEVEAAVAISLYRRLQGIQPTEYLSPLILAALYSAEPGEVVANNIVSLPMLKKFAKEGREYEEPIVQGVNDLCQQGLVSLISENIKITNAGRIKVQEYHAIRKTEKEQAYGQFELNLQRNHTGAKDSDLAQCGNLAEEVIVANFAHRGLVIANKIFSGHSARADELSDVFGHISDKAAEIEDMELRAAFIEAVHQFIAEPNPPQRDYLASVSQGYFLYHLVGLDPKCGEMRKEIFQKTIWLCDSNVILPFIATGCFNHDYALDLFGTLTDEKALLCTTPKLLQEAWEHFEWASRFVEHNQSNSLEFLRAALIGGSYNQNLFLDGYIRLSAQGKVGTFNDYLKLIFASRTISRDAFEEKLANAGLRVITISEVNGFIQEDWVELECATAEIQKIREESGTYRSQLQVESESEILTLLRNLRSGKYSIDNLDNAEHFYFISQSQVMDRVSQQEPITTWSPEAIYRYLSALSKKAMNPDLLQQCMLHEYYYAGISFIDKERYEHFFGPSIDASKVSYQTERSTYISQIEDTYTKNVDDAFEQTPDLEKPFFATQMGWQLARQSKQKEDLAKQRASNAEAKVKKLESEKEGAWRSRKKRTQEQEEARLRNLQDPKHVRKRKRQSKKRKRRK